MQNHCTWEGIVKFAVTLELLVLSLVQCFQHQKYLTIVQLMSTVTGVWFWKWWQVLETCWNIAIGTGYLIFQNPSCGGRCSFKRNLPDKMMTDYIKRCKGLWQWRSGHGFALLRSGFGLIWPSNLRSCTAHPSKNKNRDQPLHDPLQNTRYGPSGHRCHQRNARGLGGQCCGKWPVIYGFGPKWTEPTRNWAKFDEFWGDVNPRGED